ncbi:hypothetical protein [Arthrobacter ramosus]|uniref:Uncharacterized protein n=1 Tax=Arthrobacter ramosus TaxID=1672 RepID=A0ABV5XVJ2_ARTRM|nr:hypothetical protein [Arthrobacter ramosus]
MAATSASESKWEDIPSTLGFVNVSVSVDGTDMTPEAKKLADTCLDFLNNKAHLPAVRCGNLGRGAAAGGVAAKLTFAVLKFLVEKELKKFRDGVRRRSLLSLRRSLPKVYINLWDERGRNADFKRIMALLPGLNRHVLAEFAGYDIEFLAVNDSSAKQHITCRATDAELMVEDVVLVWNSFLEEHSNKQSISLMVSPGRWGSAAPACTTYPSPYDVQKAGRSTQPPTVARMDDLRR